jgi:alcohol dehydrogenase
VVVDYRTQHFDEVLADYDVVFDTQGGETLERSFRVVRSGGRIITVGGVPDANFARAYGLNWFLVLALGFMTRRVTRLAKERGVHFEYLFMRADGIELAKITELVESGQIRPVVDRTFPLDSIQDALAYVETGRAKGKVVVVMKGE